MGAEEEEGFIEKMVREQSLLLQPVGGRVFLHNAKIDRLDESKIELKCWWSPGFRASLDTSIRIGDDVHKPFRWDDDGVEVPDRQKPDEVGWDLLDCPVMLLIHRTEDGWLADNGGRTADDAILGQLSYHAPIKTADGVVDEDRPTIQAWVALGPDNFKLLRERLASTDTLDFVVGLTARFPRGSVESGWVDTKVSWDGKESLPVTSATFAWQRADWDSDSSRQREVYRTPEPQEYEPPREHTELLQAVSRLEYRMAKLATPLWLGVFAAILVLFFTR